MRALDLLLPPNLQSCTPASGGDDALADGLCDCRTLLARLNSVTTFTKVVALALQFLDRKDKDEPVLTVEEEAADYEA
jgi:hypothetical protein